ncbi:MAG: peptidylprolyl isomerase [Nanoarchaeota archaeon]
MTNVIAKNDFVEFRFTGKVKDGEIFDTNIPESAKLMGLEMESKPVVICVGHQMILPKLDEFLIGKELYKDYNVNVTPKEGFGERKREMMKVLPIEVFVKQNLRPVVGAVFSFDDMPAKITAYSGGRVTVDFNNPLAGKDLVYDLKVVKKVDDLKEQVKSLILFYFRNNIAFEIKEKVVVLDIDPKIKPFLEAFSGKFKEILGMTLDVKEKKEEVKKAEVSNNK